MRIFYDFEFDEDGTKIDPISVGMVTEDGDEYYAVNADMDADRIARNPWLMENVVPSLPFWPIRPVSFVFGTEHPDVKRKATIALEVRDFILSKPDPELWAWYAAYDHVCLAQLWGKMIDLPPGIPMWTNDLRQEAQRLGNPALPEQPTGVHNALADARHNLVRARYLDNLEQIGNQ